MKTGGCGSIVIRTIEESPSNQIRLIWDNWKFVTVFRDGIGKVSHSCEFGEVWIIRLGTWDVSVYTRCYIWSIRNPWDICDIVYIADLWTTVNKDGSCMPTRKNMQSTLVEIYLWATRVLRTEVVDLIQLSLGENRAEPDPWLFDYALDIWLSQLASSFPTWFAPCLVNYIRSCSKEYCGWPEIKLWTRLQGQEPIFKILGDNVDARLHKEIQTLKKLVKAFLQIASHFVRKFSLAFRMK